MLNGGLTLYLHPAMSKNQSRDEICNTFQKLSTFENITREP